MSIQGMVTSLAALLTFPARTNQFRKSISDARQNLDALSSSVPSQKVSGAGNTNRFSLAFETCEDAKHLVRREPSSDNASAACKSTLQVPVPLLPNSSPFATLASRNWRRAKSLARTHEILDYSSPNISTPNKNLADSNHASSAPGTPATPSCSEGRSKTAFETCKDAYIKIKQTLKRGLSVISRRARCLLKRMLQQAVEHYKKNPRLCQLQLAMLVLVVLGLVVAPVLLAMGFSSIGPVAGTWKPLAILQKLCADTVTGSAAAAHQSAWGATAAFGALQSTAMTGAAATVGVIVSSVAAAAAAFAQFFKRR
ncbi:hypothetical protein LTR17_024232 [Elasticomyces elasticus]|nr:hypothetical protein LTR17_024232 [Elasticomyces elasticus]